jgi:hypothetical protein
LYSFNGHFADPAPVRPIDLQGRCDRQFQSGTQRVT